MLVVTTENVAGHRILETKGQVFGVVVRSRGLGGNIMAGLRSLVDRMVMNARLMQANAIVMMRFDSSEMGQTMSEVVAYGTAVVIDPAP
jgi:uncharacterized protein YbjQ (UPF0145 family)